MTDKTDGKKIELNLKDNVTAADAIGKSAPTKEQIDAAEKAIVLLLLDGKRALLDFAELLKKIGLKHSAQAVNNAIDSIEIDLEQYRKQKEAENAK